jgi:subtilisin family serine protease
LQGCEIVSENDPTESTADQVVTTAAPTSDDYSKLRHAHLLDRARSVSTAGKTESSTTQLLLGLNIYEADGITPRVLGKFDVTRRILEQFGITKRLLDKYGDDLRFKVTYDQTINAISVSVNDTILEELIQDIQNDPDFAWVEPDVAIDASVLGRVANGSNSKQIIPWGVERIGAYTGEYLDFHQVTVFVLDSGVYQHNDIGLEQYKDFTMLFVNRTAEFWDDSLAQTTPVYDPGEKGDPNDYLGHGTHVAGTLGAFNNRKGIVGAAPAVSINSLKVLTDDGRTDITTLLAAVDYVTDYKLEHLEEAVIVNMSLGADIGTTTYNALDEAIVESIEKGVVYVISAGNDGQNADTYSPAHVREAITVGSYDVTGTYSPFSNFGSSVDLLAPGELIVSLSNIRDEVMNNVAILGSGTSYAAPHVTAAAAHYLRLNPTASPAQVEAALVAASRTDVAHVPAGTTNRSVYVGTWSGAASTTDTSTSGTKSSRKNK